VAALSAIARHRPQQQQQQQQQHNDKIALCRAARKCQYRIIGWFITF